MRHALQRLLVTAATLCALLPNPAQAQTSVRLGAGGIEFGSRKGFVLAEAMFVGASGKVIHSVSE